jgi:hypothetical protein
MPYIEAGTDSFPIYVFGDNSDDIKDITIIIIIKEANIFAPSFITFLGV